MSDAPKLKIRRTLVVLFVLALLSVGAYAVDTPSAFLIALIPLAYTIPAFIWLDRLEPEPRAMRWNAFLWGGGISVLVASVANEYTDASFGTTAALVISAPVAEEIMKTLGILGAAKRNQIDSPLDGVVYAGYVGLGFAMVENIIYFSQAIADDDLGLVFVMRGLFSPFAHPFFTLWVGLAIGAAVQKGRSRRFAAMRGLFLAMALHASWNASGVNGYFALLLLGHIVLFVIVVRRLRRMRREEIALVQGRLKQLAFTHQLSPVELEAYGDLRATRRLRQGLPRKDRPAFDERRVMITKLALREQNT
ncbi:MAG: PrsW family intramembrane metalloprotease [Actinobacteria bacterium]|nr:PrsW family intramembrane metalloprotease [Actinomycetota bacterium]